MRVVAGLVRCRYWGAKQRLDLVPTADSTTAASSRFVSVCDVAFLASSSNVLDPFPRSSRVEGPGLEFAGVFGLSLN
jgi:hypothetical protein